MEPEGKTLLTESCQWSLPRGLTDCSFINLLEYPSTLNMYSYFATRLLTHYSFPPLRLFSPLHSSRSVVLVVFTLPRRIVPASVRQMSFSSWWHFDSLHLSKEKAATPFTAVVVRVLFSSSGNNWLPEEGGGVVFYIEAYKLLLLSFNGREKSALLWSQHVIMTFAPLEKSTKLM